MSGYAFIALSAFNSLLIAHVLKQSETRLLNTLKVLVVNYIVAVLSAILLISSTNQKLIPSVDFWFWPLVTFTGILFIMTFFVYSKSVHLNGVGITVASMRISLLIPILFSIGFYNEPVTVYRVLGITLVCASLYLLILGKTSNNLFKNGYLLIIIFLFTGIGDTTLKIFEQHGIIQTSEAHFIGFIYVFALCTGLAILFYKKDVVPNYLEVKAGIFIGVPNFLSSFFLLKSLTVLDATLVYSITNVTIVAGGIVLGTVYWRDRPSFKQLIGLTFAIVAIIILI